MRYLLLTAVCFTVGVAACVAVEDARAHSQSWAWYKSPVTQCVVNHEGGWESIGYVDGRATYFGRFQMDVSFMRETAYGRRAYRRWGLAHRWPPVVQVYHAWTIWKYAGWSRWPTYARYCR